MLKSYIKDALRLSMSQSITAEHQGKIACESSAGEGTKFNILLPLRNISKHRGR